ncbi:FecR domain-containing protein [SAR92 clade bacterium H231]|nr:FecR domain-containing protein [SAR92 clade bacterium H231]
MNNIHPMPDNQQLYDQASQWIVKMDRGLSADEQTALQEWLGTNQQHRNIMAEMTQLWDKMDAMSRLGDLFADPQPAPRQWRGIGAVAASVLLAASLGLWALLGAMDNNNSVYHTAVGEQSTVMLPDGSQIILNTNTKVAVNYSPQARLLQLISGELHVSVAKDPNRPLSVMAAGQIVQALGTEFNIEITDQQNIELVVTEGKVKVGVQQQADALIKDDNPSRAQLSLPDNALTLAAGEQMLLGGKQKAITEVTLDDIAVKLSWREGNLIFRGESLEEAVKEIGRYTSVEFVFVNEHLKTMRVSGLFKAGDVEGLLATLRKNFNIVSQRDGEGKVLLSSQ